MVPFKSVPIHSHTREKASLRPRELPVESPYRSTRPCPTRYPAVSSRCFTASSASSSSIPLLSVATAPFAVVVLFVVDKPSLGVGDESGPAAAGGCGFSEVMR